MAARWLGALAVVLVATGCATVPNLSVENLKGPLPSENGLVIAESISNSIRIVGPVERWTELVLWRMGDEEPKTFSLEALKFGHTTQAYMGSVPPGTYRLGLLYATLVIGDTTYYGRAPVPPALGTFEVRPGQITNLGTIIYQPFQAKNRVETSYPDYAITRTGNDSLWTSLKEIKQDVASQIDDSLPMLGWNPDEFGDKRSAALELISGGGLPTNIHNLGNGTLLASGFLGAIYEHDGNAWRRHSLPTHYKVTDLGGLGGGRILAGSEFGEMVLIPSPGEKPLLIGLEEEAEHIVDIDVSETNVAYVITMTPEVYRVHEFSPDKLEFETLKEFPNKSRGFWADAYGIGISRPVTVASQQGVAIFIDGKVHRYDGLLRSWSVEDSAEFNDLHQQLDGYILGTPYSAWNGSKALVYSDDYGHSWTASKDARNFFLGASETPTYRFSDGVLVRTGNDVKRSLFSSEVLPTVPVNATSDNGTTWEQVGEVPPGCTTLAVEASTDALLHLLCTDGRILSSEDRGANWSELLNPRIPEFEDFPRELRFRYQRDD